MILMISVNQEIQTSVLGKMENGVVCVCVLEGGGHLMLLNKEETLKLWMVREKYMRGQDDTKENTI